MKIDSVLKMDDGAVVCVENNAKITIKKTGDGCTYTSSFPVGYPPMDADTFKQLYRSKTFKSVESKPTTSKASK